jgi:hypothetical protein
VKTKQFKCTVTFMLDEFHANDFSDSVPSELSAEDYIQMVKEEFLLPEMLTGDYTMEIEEQK